MKVVQTFSRLLASVIVAITVFFPLIANAVTQQDLDNKKAQQQQAQAQADQKAKDAAQMKDQISIVDDQINEIQAALNKTNSSLDSTQNVIDDLSSKISEQEIQLSAEKEKLYEVISNWYMEGDIDFFETLVSSESLAALVSKQQYYDSIKQQVNNKMEQIIQLKNQLAAQKDEQQKKIAELQNLQQQQSAYKKSAENQLAFKTQMLNMTLSQQKNYLALVAKLQNDISHISAELYARRRKSYSGTPGALGYPYMQPPGVYVIDPWNFYMSECTGYAAWYWNQRLGKSWDNTRPGSGSAWNWPALARDQGYSVSSTPRAGAIISWGASSLTSQWGHVAIVDSVNSDGTINISEYNWSYNHGGDTRSNIHPGDYGSYSYIY